MQIYKLPEESDDQSYLMQWESQPLHYEKHIISEDLPKVTLTVPHERARTLIINKQGLLSTEDSSSFVYFMRVDPSGISDPVFIKVLDASSFESPLDNLIPNLFLRDAEKAIQFMPMHSYLS